MRRAGTFLFIPLLLMLSYPVSYAQERGIGYHADSVIKKGKPDTSVIKSYVRLAEIFLGSDPDTTLYLCQKGLDRIAVHLPGATGRREYVLLKAKGDMFSHQTQVYYYRGDPEKCLGLLNRAYLIYQKIGYEAGVASCLNDLGFIYDKQGNVQKALEYTLKALRLLKQEGNKSDRASVLNNIGIYYKALGNADNALRFFNQSLKLREELGNREGIANSLGNIAAVYIVRGDNEQALAHYQRAMALQEEVGHMEGKVKSLVGISGIHEGRGETGKALKTGREAMRLARGLDYPVSIQVAAGQLAGLEKELGHYDSALAHYRLHILMKDSISTYEMEKREGQRELKAQTEKELLVKQGEMQLEEDRARAAKARGRQFLYAILVVMVLLVAFAIFMANRFRVARAQKVTIEEQKKTVDEHQKEITDSINYAENIQKALLPAEGLVRECLPENFILFRPKDVVSGDFYWMTKKGGRVYFAACDCTGHGVPGAFMSMLNSSLLTEAVTEKGIEKPNEIFYDVRKGIIDALKQTGESGTQKDGMDAALCAWNCNGTLEYALANNSLILIRDGVLEETRADRQPVSILTGEQKPFTHHELKLKKGDVIYLFSDGYPDQFGGPKDRKFMMKRFKQLLLDIHFKPMSQQKELLQKTMDEWMGDTEQIDDILVMGVRF